MAYIGPEELAGQLPHDGQGVTQGQIGGALEAAKEEVVGMTGDEDGNSALARQAVINLALAELLDTVIFPGDARRPGSESSALRTSASRALAAFERIKADADPSDGVGSVPDGYVGTLSY